MIASSDDRTARGGQRSLAFTDRDVLLVIDLQRAVVAPSPWALPGAMELAASIVDFAAGFPGTTIATRYIVPRQDRAVGRWRAFGRRWESMHDNDEIWELLPGVGAVSDHVVDKTTYSSWAAIEPLVGAGLLDDPPSTPDPASPVTAGSTTSGGRLLLTGVETECCVVATALAAVDAGIHVVVDAAMVGGPNPAMGTACLDLLRRLPEQVVVMDSVGA